MASSKYNVSPQPQNQRRTKVPQFGTRAVEDNVAYTAHLGSGSCQGVVHQVGPRTDKPVGFELKEEVQVRFLSQGSTSRTAARSEKCNIQSPVILIGEELHPGLVPSGESHDHENSQAFHGLVNRKRGHPASAEGFTAIFKRARSENASDEQKSYDRPQHSPMSSVNSEKTTAWIDQQSNGFDLKDSEKTTTWIDQQSNDFDLKDSETATECIDQQSNGFHLDDSEIATAWNGQQLNGFDLNDSGTASTWMDQQSNSFGSNNSETATARVHQLRAVYCSYSGTTTACNDKQLYNFGRAPLNYTDFVFDGAQSQANGDDFGGGFSYKVPSSNVNQDDRISTCSMVKSVAPLSQESKTGDPVIKSMRAARKSSGPIVTVNESQQHREMPPRSDPPQASPEITNSETAKSKLPQNGDLEKGWRGCYSAAFGNYRKKKHNPKQEEGSSNAPQINCDVAPLAKKHNKWKLTPKASPRGSKTPNRAAIPEFGLWNKDSSQDTS